MRRVVAFLLLLGAGLAGEERASPEQMRQFLFFAVLEGLYADGVDDACADMLLAKESLEVGERPMHFVPGCPVCLAVRNALLVYRARPPFEGWKGGRDTFGPGLEAGLRKRLLQGGFAERLDVLRKLVRDWVERRRPDAAMRAALEEGRRLGMEALGAERRQGGASALAALSECAVCEGASGR